MTLTMAGLLAGPSGRSGPGARPSLRSANLGPVAETFLRAAAATGTPRLAHELTAIAEWWAAIWRRSALGRPGERPRTPAPGSSRHALDPPRRSRRPGPPLRRRAPEPRSTHRARPAAFRLRPGACPMSAAEAPALAPDLELGLRHLKFRAMRSLACSSVSSLDTGRVHLAGVTSHTRVLWVSRQARNLSIPTGVAISARKFRGPARGGLARSQREREAARACRCARNLERGPRYRPLARRSGRTGPGSSPSPPNPRC